MSAASMGDQPNYGNGANRYAQMGGRQPVQPQPQNGPRNPNPYEKRLTTGKLIS